jgi:LuxR family maltose regulon positive regulatory protein
VPSGKKGDGRGTTTAQPLFESKLHPPRGRSSLVPRTALVDRLIGDEAPITSIVAPPGYGKTTLLAQWAERASAPVAWLSVDHHDNDLTQLLSYTAAALERADQSDAMRMHPSARTVAGAASEVADAMARMKEPVTLILDHVESLENADCLDTVAELALHLPPGARLALATRIDPPLPIPRLRAGGEIIEVGVAELAMDNEEARRLLSQAGVELPDDELDQVIERTEGWPVGLYLAALALKAGASRESVGIPFSGDDRLVAEYLRAEVLDNLSTADVEFLTRTAILERLNPALCDAVLATEGSRDVLASLVHSNQLLVPLDRQGDWYRYHHLFRDLLRAELMQRQPALASTLHLRAAQWCEENAFPELAIEHAQAGGDPDRLNRLVITYHSTFYASGRRTVVRRWLTWFEDQGLLDQYPALAILGVLMFTGTGQDADSERWAAAVERPSLRPSDAVLARAAPDRVLPDGSTLAGWLAMLRLTLQRDGLDGIVRDAHDADEHLGAGSGFRTGLLAFQGLARLYSDDVEGADLLFARASQVGIATGRVPTVAITNALQGLIAANLGDWEEAERYAALALAIVDEWALDDYSESAMAYALAARMAHHRSDDDGARELMTRASRLRPLLSTGRPIYAAAALLELARNYADLDDAPGAREVIRQAREILRQRPGLGTLPSQLDAVETRIETMHTGRVGASSLTAAELRVVPYLPTHLTFPQIAERLHLSRNTVKTQAISIYQKLDVSSRGEAVAKLLDLGLLEG